MHRDLQGREYLIFNSKEIERRDAETVVQWKPIKIGNYTTRHEVSNTGIVRNRYTKIPLKYEESKNGYCRVVIVGKHYLVHRLVALAFIRIPKKYKDFSKLVVNHLDGYKWHNYAYNLEWCTEKENMEHARRIGLNKGILGERSHLAKMTEKQAIRCCELLSDGISVKDIALEVGVSEKSIQHIKSGESWKDLAKKYTFPKLGKSIPGTISDKTIHEICKLLEEKKYKDKEIAEKYNVAREYIRDIRLGKRRKNISKLYQI